MNICAVLLFTSNSRGAISSPFISTVRANKRADSLASSLYICRTAWQSLMLSVAWYISCEEPCSFLESGLVGYLIYTDTFTRTQQYHDRHANDANHAIHIKSCLLLFMPNQINIEIVRNQTLLTCCHDSIIAMCCSSFMSRR